MTDNKNNEITYHQLIPPPEAFKYKLEGKTENVYKQSGNLNTIAERVDYPYEGGMLVYHQGLKYPSKGIRYDREMVALDYTKSLLMTVLAGLNPFSIFQIYGIRTRFTRTAYQILKPHILNERFMKQSSRDAWNLTYNVCKELDLKALRRLGIEDTPEVIKGLKENYAVQVADIVSSFIEYDNAYDLILKDLFMETTYEDLLNHPIREVLKMMNLFMQRNGHIGKKFKKLAYIGAILLCIPRVLRAYKGALTKLGHTPFQADEADKYFMLNQTYYDYMGRSFEDRSKEWIAINGKDVKFVYKRI
jgi:hypothetical protein